MKKCRWEPPRIEAKSSEVHSRSIGLLIWCFKIANEVTHKLASDGLKKV
jgi:hypothetical protein